MARGSGNKFSWDGNKTPLLCCNHMKICFHVTWVLFLETKTFLKHVFEYYFWTKYFKLAVWQCWNQARRYCSNHSTSSGWWRTTTITKLRSSRSIWARLWLVRRKVHGVYHTIFKEFKQEDSEGIKIIWEWTWLIVFSSSEIFSFKGNQP